MAGILDKYTITILFTALFIIFLGWHFFAKKRDNKDSIMERIQKPDVNRMVEIVEKSREVVPTTFIEKVEFQLEQSGIGWTVQRYFISTVGAAVVGAFAGGIFFHSTMFIMALAVLGLYAPTFLVGRKRKKNIEVFGLQFRNALQRMASMVRAGGSTKQSILDVAINHDSHPLIRTEFKRAHTDIEYGYTTEEAFFRMFERTGNPDVKMVSIVAEIQRQKGGNLAELFDSIQKTITDRTNQQRRLKTLTAQQRGQANLLTIIPFGVYCLFMIVNPHYYKDFLAKPSGTFVTLGCMIAILMGNVIMRKITSPK